MSLLRVFALSFGSGLRAWSTARQLRLFLLKTLPYDVLHYSVLTTVISKRKASRWSARPALHHIFVSALLHRDL